MRARRIISRFQSKDARAAAKLAERENDRGKQAQMLMRQHFNFVVQTHRETARQAERPRAGAKRAA